MIVISHDRWFLDRMATHILAFEGELKWFGLTEIMKKVSVIGVDDMARMPISQNEFATSQSIGLKPCLLIY